MARTWIGGSRHARVGVVLVVLLAVTAPGCSSKARRKKALKYVEAGKDAHYGGDKKKGLRYYNEAVKIDPKCKDAYVCRGTLYNEAGYPEKALKDFTTAIKLDPNDNYPYEQRAGIYENHLHDQAKAEADREKAFQIRERGREDFRQRAAKKRRQ